MRKAGWTVLIALAIVAAVVVAMIALWPWLRLWLPHPALVKAWMIYLVVDLKIDRWGPVVILMLVGVIELVWALNLGRRSAAFERQWKRLERLHAKEVEALSQEIALLKDERRALQTALEQSQDLVDEEKVRLWIQFEDLQRASGLPANRLIVLASAESAPAVRSEWRQIIAQLERIEMVDSSLVRKGESAVQRQQRADELLQVGVACFHLGQYERALTHCTKVIDLTPNEAEAWINRGMVNYSLGRQQAALRDLDHALKLSESPLAYHYRGLILERQGDERRALEDYARAVRLDSDFVTGYYRRGLLYARAGEYDKAFQDQNRVLELDGDHAGAYSARGAARAALGDSQWALTDLDRGCTLAPQRYQGFLDRGRVRFQLEMYSEALADFGRGIELAPTVGSLFMARGDTYAVLGEDWRAAADYSKAIELEPKNATAYHARGRVRSDMREYRRAVEDCDLALELDPGLATALAERGAAYEKLGEHELAIGDLDRAIGLNPNMALAYYNRGLAYGSRGEYDRASRDLNKAIELDPSLRDRQEGKLGTY